MKSKIELWMLLMSFGTILVIPFIPSLSYADQEHYKITIQNHQFEPQALSVPANQKIKLIVENLDPTPEEFESYHLNREKIIAAKGQITLYLGPLKPGEYQYFGDFHQNTAKGLIIAKEDMEGGQK